MVTPSAPGCSHQVLPVAADVAGVTDKPAETSPEWVSDRAVVGFIGGLFGTMLGAVVISAVLPVPYFAAAVALFVLWAATMGRSMLRQASSRRDDIAVRPGVRPVRPLWVLGMFITGTVIVLVGIGALLTLGQ
jgi:hypothetical protein